MKLANLFFLFFLLVGLASCKKDKIEPIKIVVNDNVKFSTDIYPIFDNYSCTPCHGSSGGLDLTGSSSVVINNLLSSNSPAVIANKSDESPFYTYFAGGASHNGKSLTTQESENIKGWIDQGAQDN